MRPSSPARSVAVSMGLAQALGLAPSDDRHVVAARTDRLDETGRQWPMALAALLIAPALMIGLAMADGVRVAPIALAATPALLAALIGSAALMVERASAVPPHLRTVAVAVAGSLAAVSLALMMRVVPGPGGLVATTGAIVVTALALGASRVAALAFAGALAAMVPVATGSGIATLAALLLVAPLAIGLIRSARTDLARLAERAAADAAGDVAERLVAEFEAQGSGWFWQTDRHGTVTYLSAKVDAELTAKGLAGLGGRLTDVLRVDSQLADTERTLSFHFSSRTAFSDYSVRPVSDTRGERWWSISGRPAVDALGRFQGFVGWGSDLTEKRRSEAEITRLALFDSLTGLANRQRMKLSLDQTLAEGAPGGGVTGLFLMDLDRFKAVNDTLGHQTGDALLKQVAIRLQRAVGDAGLVGRLGGDEFQVVLPGEGNRDTLGHLARAVIASLSQPYFIDGSSITIGCSIGIAIAPDHGQDAEALIRGADLALYAAKADGRGVHRFYREELLAGARSRKQLEDDLRQALPQGEFHLAYQPVVSTRDETIVGYEALLRWTHPTKGAISPADFVPVAEEAGLIERIGEWVLRQACQEAAAWPPHVRVAVNVSPIQFANPQLPAIVTRALAAAGLAPARLELEITEGVFLNDSDQAEAMFAALKRLGVRLALDDFGTGYSSLGYLKKAPFDKIKIDQSFVRGAIQPGNRNAAIIRAIVSLAGTLGMETTAEGVEQQDEITLIRDLGCSHIQGYVYGRPAPAAAVAEQLATAGGRAAPIGHKVSRSPRTTLLRAARMEIGEASGEVRLRNLSATGVMVDGVNFPPELVGADCLIELVEDEMARATIRWTDGNRAGLQFAEAIDLERLAAPARGARRAA